MAKEEQIKTFPSPRGDKLCQVRQQRQKSKAEVSFRPLAGISCVLCVPSYLCKIEVSVPSRG